MFLQNNDLGRILLIYIAQLIFSFLFIFIAYKILQRNRNRLTLTLSGFYISISIGLILNAIYPPLKVNPLVTIIYIIASYLVLFAPIFLILFNFNILKIDAKFSSKNQIIYVIIYIFVLILCLNVPGGIRVNENTQWRPMYSWFFSIILYLFISIFIILPIIILSVKLSKSFKDTKLKKKLRFFFLGIFGLAFNLYGMILYNTLDDQLFRLIWLILTSVVLIFSAVLIYYAWIYRL